MKFKAILSGFSDLISKVKNHKYDFNPFFLYFTIIWSASKVVQITFDHKYSVWEISWMAFLRVYGKMLTSFKMKKK
jgi:hypothetical protein